MASLFNGRGRAWLARQPVPDDGRVAIERHARELDRLGEELAELDRDIALGVMDDASVRRLMTITGVNLTVAGGIMAAIGDVSRFESPLEAREPLRPEPAPAPVGPRRGPSRPDRQGRPQPRPRDAGRG
jgi:transposase